MTGIFRRHLETIDRLEWVTNVPAAALQAYLLENNFVTERLETKESVFQGKTKIYCYIFIMQKQNSFIINYSLLPAVKNF
jgi:hypothetical protein